MTRGLKVAACTAIFSTCMNTASCINRKNARRTKWLEKHTKSSPVLSDPKDCTETQLSSTLHNKRGVEGAEFVERWAVTHNRLRENAQDALRSNEYFNELPDDMFVTMGGSQDVDYIYWGAKTYDIFMSAYTPTDLFTSTFNCGPECFTWNFVDPSVYQSKPIRSTILLDDGANYVVLASVFMNQYQHVLIDHLGYLAFLRKMLPDDTKFIVQDWYDEKDHSKGHHLERFLNVMDAQFAKERVVFLQCPSLVRCAKKVEIRNGGQLTLFNPPMPTRNAKLFSLVREWFLTVYTPKPQSLSDKTVIFYTRQMGDHLRNGRIMDQEQERLMIDLIKHFMKRFDRPERLVIFDGSLSIEAQIDLFQSATIIIGPHGGGLANLLFTLPGATCESRPKVVEFITSGATEQLQHGMPTYTFYYFFQTIPWLELHNVFFAEDSTENSTLVNLRSFHDAVFDIFTNHKVASREGIKASSLKNIDSYSSDVTRHISQTISNHRPQDGQ